jgi:hypothetical protein
MPSYQFVDENGNETTEFMWVSEVEQYLKDNPHLKLGVHAGAGDLDPWRMGRKKPDEGFREILRGIQRKYKGNTVDSF